MPPAAGTGSQITQAPPKNATILTVTETFSATQKHRTDILSTQMVCGSCTARCRQEPPFPNRQITFPPTAVPIKEDAGSVKNDWRSADGKRYYFDAEGNAVRGCGISAAINTILMKPPVSFCRILTESFPQHPFISWSTGYAVRSPLMHRMEKTAILSHTVPSSVRRETPIHGHLREALLPQTSTAGIPLWGPPTDSIAQGSEIPAYFSTVSLWIKYDQL